MDECCKDVVALLSAYHDGEVSPSELDMVDKHLAECASCRKELSRLSRTVELVAELPQINVDEVQYIKGLRAQIDRPRSAFERFFAFLEPAQLASAASILGVLLLCLVYTNGVYWGVDTLQPVEPLPNHISDPISVPREPAQPLVVAKATVEPGKALKTNETVATPKSGGGAPIARPTTPNIPSLLASHQLGNKPNKGPKVATAPAVAPAQDAKSAFTTLAKAAMKYQKVNTATSGGSTNIKVPGKKFKSNVDWDELTTTRYPIKKGRPLVRARAPKMATRTQVAKLFGSLVHVIERKPGEFKTGENELPHTGQIVLEVNDLPAFFKAAAKEFAAHKNFKLTRVNFDPKDETEFYLSHANDDNSETRFVQLRNGLNGLDPVKGILSIQNDADGLAERVIKVNVRPVTLSR